MIIILKKDANQPNTGISIFQSVFIKQTQPKPVI